MRTHYIVATMPTSPHAPKRVHPVSVRLDDEVRDKLRAIAARESRSISNLIYLIVRDWVAKQEGRASKKR
jgi:predicted transcriptional regulator